MDRYLQLSLFDSEPDYDMPAYRFVLGGDDDGRLYSRHEMELYLCDHPDTDARFVLDTMWSRRYAEVIAE